MNRNMTVLMLFMLLVAFRENAEGEEVTGISIDEAVPAKNVAIKNLERSQTVYFSIKIRRLENKYFLRPSESMKFQCDKQCDIALMQKDKSRLVRRLSQVKRYGIYWDKSKQIFEIGEADL